MFCYHHTDLDGHSSGYIVSRICDIMKIPYTPYDFKGVNYDNPMNAHKGHQDIIFITDLSFTQRSKGTLFNLCKDADKVIWVDHHQSSLDLCSNEEFRKEMPKNLFAFIGNGGCGALNAFRLIQPVYNSFGSDNSGINKEYYDILCAILNGEHTEGIHILPDDLSDINVPFWLIHVDDYDRFVLKYPYTMDFINGMNINDIRTVIKDDETGKLIINTLYRDLDNDDDDTVNALLDAGCAINSYLDNRYARELSHAFEVTVKDKDGNDRVILCKNAHHNSTNFLHKFQEYDAVSIFYFNGKGWVHSVYAKDSSTFDCKEFCERYGGGGHFHAAGFQRTIEEGPLWLTMMK